MTKRGALQYFSFAARRNVCLGCRELEQSTWSGHARIEKIAREKLGMRTPLPGQVMLVESSNDAPSKATALPKAD